MTHDRETVARKDPPSNRCHRDRPPWCKETTVAERPQDCNPESAVREGVEHSMADDDEATRDGDGKDRDARGAQGGERKRVEGTAMAERCFIGNAEPKR